MFYNLGARFLVPSKLDSLQQFSFVGVSFSRSTCETSQMFLLKSFCTCLISTTYLFLPCDFKRRLTEPLGDKVLYGTCLRECVFVS